ncbi:MAG: molecular chaperone HtpG, partial [Prevotella sp.]|nr:molecular chaperone HtpG [Prevotella sp.]
VDFPFSLTGILYFPRIKSNIELQRNKVQLFCNQVFVTDQVEGIVPDFMTLLHGVIDSPDIPLNVSRSYLQSDANVKKISTYITKKVSDRLSSLFKEDRKGFEEKWDDLKIFMHYGMLSEQDFYDRAKDFALLKDTEGKYYTYEEYKTLIKDLQTDKDGQTVYLYATKKDDQYSYIESARAKDYHVLLMDGELDVPMASMLEQKIEKSRFVRVDSDVIERLIVKDDEKREELGKDDSDKLSVLFTSQLPTIEKSEIHVDVQPLGAEQRPVVITQSEYMRRMKDMSRLQGGMAFYAQMPDMYTMVLNSDHPLVQRVLSEAGAATTEALKPIEGEIRGQEARLAVLRQERDKKKAEEVTDAEKEEISATEKKIGEEKDKRRNVLSDYAKGNDVIHQLIDLALLQNGMLKGSALDAFLSRSISMIK